MPQLRKDPVTDRWVIVAPDRIEFAGDDRTGDDEPRAFCPFCYGNEDKTPAEILAYRRQGCGPDQQGWRIRVVPNRFPALQTDCASKMAGRGVYDWMSGTGLHEVIIEHPDHDAGFHSYTTEEVELILWSYRDRFVDLCRDRRFKYLMIFKNSGRRAGASIDHPHSQLITTPVVPKRVVEEMNGASAYYRYKERCVYCDMIRQELQDGRRVVAVNERFVALCPFAARFPYELVVLPRRHRSDFGSLDADEIRDCASVLREAMRMLMAHLHRPAYNYLVHTSPCDSLECEHYHWHIEIVPRISRIAGFEFGSGFYCNPVPPEEAAVLLKEAGAAGDLSPDGRSGRPSGTGGGPRSAAAASPRADTDEELGASGSMSATCAGKQPGRKSGR